MKAGAKMPAVDGETAGMTPENCMAYCFNHPRNYKFFGEKTLSPRVEPRHREEITATAGTAKKMILAGLTPTSRKSRSIAVSQPITTEEARHTAHR